MKKKTTTSRVFIIFVFFFLFRSFILGQQPKFYWKGFYKTNTWNAITYKQNLYIYARSDENKIIIFTQTTLNKCFDMWRAWCLWLVHIKQKKTKNFSFPYLKFSYWIIMWIVFICAWNRTDSSSTFRRQFLKKKTSVNIKSIVH